MKGCRKIYRVDGMTVTEEMFTGMCKAAGVDEYPRRKLKPKLMFSNEPDEWEIDAGPAGREATGTTTAATEGCWDTIGPKG